MLPKKNKFYITTRQTKRQGDIVYEVKDGSRTLKFSGKLLGKSSSLKRGSTRWIEFALYKTENGSYVLSRVGVSLVYHGAACPLVKRYGLVESSITDLSEDAIPCDECQPSLELPVIFPEKHRNWAQVSEDPEAVLEALYKYDNGGARYLTNVAQRLLEQAAEADEKIESVYRVEMIP
jgi:hypothetical protein